MAEPARRRDDRLPCDLDAAIRAPSTGAKVADVRLTDLGLGGASLRCALPLRRGVSYELEVPRRGLEPWRFPARLAWEGKRDAKTGLYGFGVTFVLTVRQEQRLRELVDEVRRGPWTSGS
jgi:hypothetical protein